MTIKDSILTNAGYGVYRPDYASITVTNSNVWGNSTNYYGASPGAGCIAQNPLFVSSTDLRLTLELAVSVRCDGQCRSGRAAVRQCRDARPLRHAVVEYDADRGDGPYTAGGDLTVAPSVTLTIEPGTTLLFQDGTDIMGSSYTGRRSPRMVAAS